MHYLSESMGIVDKRSKESAVEIAYEARDYARIIAPNFNGKTQSMIVVYSKHPNNGAQATVMAKNPTKGGNNRLYSGGKYGNNFNLVKWMHETDGVFQTDNPLGRAGTRHIRSGDPNFMYTTMDWLKTNGIKKARADFRTINFK